MKLQKSLLVTKVCLEIYSISSYAFMSVVYQGSLISEMEWALLKILFWNFNDSIGKWTISIASGVSLWDRPCYQNMLNYDSDNKSSKLRQYKGWFSLILHFVTRIVRSILSLNFKQFYDKLRSNSLYEVDITFDLL